MSQQDNPELPKWMGTKEDYDKIIADLRRRDLNFLADGIEAYVASTVVDKNKVDALIEAIHAYMPFLEPINMPFLELINGISFEAFTEAATNLNNALTDVEAALQEQDKPTQEKREPIGECDRCGIGVPVDSQICDFCLTRDQEL